MRRNQHSWTPYSSGPIRALAIVAVLTIGGFRADARADEIDSGLRPSPWVLRVAAGPAFFIDAMESEPMINRYYGRILARGNVQGFGVGGEIAGAYAIAPRVVLGLSFSSYVFPRPKSDNAEIENVDTHMIMLKSPELRYEFDLSCLMSAVPFVAYHIDHWVFEAGLGAAWRVVGTGRNPVWSAANLTPQSGGSGMLSLGVGYDVPIAPTWSIGVMARVFASFGIGSEDEGKAWRHWLGLPALLVSVRHGEIPAR